VRLGVRRAAWVAAVAYAATSALVVVSALRAGDHPVVVVLGAGAALLLGVLALLRGRGGPGRRRVAYRLLLAGVITLALAWAVAVHP
jgi:hypothetical protein